MKRALKDKFSLSFFCIVLLIIASSCNNASDDNSKESASKYTCPMHPQVVTTEPGTCPICHMDLVPVREHAGHDSIDVSLENLIKPSNEIVLSSIRTVKPVAGNRTKSVQVQGIINYDTNKWNTVSSRVGGRIERLYVKYNYQYVNKGQKLMDIYSPDLANAQQELLYLKSSGDKNLLEAAKNKLRLLGATNQQINNVLKTGKVDYTFSVYSPYAGYATEQRNSGAADGSSYGSSAVISEEGSGGSMGSMGGGASPSASKVPSVEVNSALQLREGQYVSTGQKLFDLVNANSVWAEFFAGAEQLKYLKRGTSIQVTALDNESLKSFAKISLVQPYYAEGSTFSLLRARIANQDKKWKVGQLIAVKTDADSKFGNWLPRTSILSLGSKYVVFVKKGAVFAPVYVSVNEHRGDWVDIGDSLDKNTEVAVNAWFMVDSESFIQVDSLKKLTDYIN